MTEHESQHTPMSSDPESQGDITRPLAMDEIDGDGFSESSFIGEEASGSRKLNSGAIILGAVVLLAIGGLFSMRTLSRATAGSEPSEVEQTIDMFLEMIVEGEGPVSLDGPVGIENKGVLEILNESYATRQVPLSDVQRDPFLLIGEDDAAPPEATPEPEPEVDPMIAKREERKKYFEQAAGRIRVRSILMGNNPLANINNRVVGIGQIVSVEPENVNFRVTKIEENLVELVARDTQLDVSVTTRVSLREGR